MNLKSIIDWLSMLFVMQWACQNPTPKPVAPPEAVVKPVIRLIEADKEIGFYYQEKWVAPTEIPNSIRTRLKKL
jgi:hypothetical protein